jgi:RHS repeat-associated protein
MTDPLDKMTRYSYDPVGNLLQVLDRSSNPTTYTYDADNRRTTITDAQPATTTFAYDGVGNLLSLTDANGHITGFGYDQVNRKISETYPDLTNNTVFWTYDMVGNVVTRTDQKSQVTNYTYSDLYFLLSRSYPSGTDSFTYDLSGRVLTGNTTRGFSMSKRFQYDGSDRLTKSVPSGSGWNESFQYDGSDRLIQSIQNGQTISYMYDIPGRTRMLTYPGGRMITEQWDFRPQLVNISDTSPGLIVQYTYDASNNVLTRSYRNGTVATATYNANNWACSLVHTSGANLIVGFTYAYDNEGNKFYEQKLHEPGRSEAYTYDSVYRLVNYQVGTLSSPPPPDCPAGAVGVPTPVTQTAYNLDKLGNWNSIVVAPGGTQTRTHSPSNEIATINGGPVVSDFNGNTTNYGPSGYQYDEENRLIKAVSGPVMTVRGQYQYDAFGRRVAKLDFFGNQTFYYYDGWRTIEEQTSAGVTQATYIFGNYLDETLTMDRGGHTYYYHQNTLWSTYALTDSSGDGVEGYYYDAYGYQTVVTPGPDGKLDFDSDDGYAPGARSSVGNPFTFTGQRFDPETGLLYYKNRYNSAFFGRFMQRDLVDYSGGLNLYEYVNGRPTMLVDPLGTESAPPEVKPPVPRPMEEPFGHEIITPGIEKTTKALIELLGDKNAEVRTCAQKTLSAFARKEGLRKYLKYLLNWGKPTIEDVNIKQGLDKVIADLPLDPPARDLNKTRIDNLLAQLDDENFGERVKARVVLTKLLYGGTDFANPGAVRRLLSDFLKNGTPSLEVQRRVEELLKGTDKEKYLMP